MLQNFIIDKSVIMVVLQLRDDVIIVLQQLKMIVLSKFEIFKEDGPVVIEVDL